MLRPGFKQGLLIAANIIDAIIFEPNHDQHRQSASVRKMVPRWPPKHSAKQKTGVRFPAPVQ